MAKEIRIVGLSDSLEKVWVQRKTNGGWKQTVMEFAEFRTMMENEFPQYVKEFEASGSTDMENYFYNYGEDGKETYIFRS